MAAVRPSSEALLIAALVNNHDVTAGVAHGVIPEMLAGYQNEYHWLLSFHQTYGSAPGWDALLSRFPQFPRTDTVDVAFSADEVRQSADQRGLRSAVRLASQSISEGDYESAAMALGSYSPLAAMRPPQNALLDTSFLATWDEKPDALELPWRTLQAITGGLRPGDLAYLAARLGQGKSWGALTIAARALLTGRRVNLWSLEMPKMQMLIRLHVVLGQELGLAVDHVQMRDRVIDAVAYKRIVNKIRDDVPGELFLYDSTDGACTPTVISARAGDADLNIVDYIDLMSSPLGRSTSEDWRVLAAISNELKQIAIARNTRILALAQINRDGDSPSKFPPKVKNLAGSDALGRDGDLVITHKQYAKTAQVYSIEKNRHGAAGVLFFTRFLPNEGAFQEISRDSADDLRDRDELAA